MKRLYRDKNNRVIWGVIGGLGRYFDIDPALLRLAWLFIVVFTGFIPGIIVYLFAAALVPQSPEE